ncbi:hypothetical protein [Lignipirellula cremea]|uniref:Uncharacterized protein n=1 Tax=Lignipirellula cremea TaxID=2528010 RepID=A0A518E4Y7_9BACT|nr:hypothetical protein [Lignipirellula cremea]QDU99160.1 hypothetical protein Pla8534_70720 [Lignipirellula cremea]
MFAFPDDFEWLYPWTPIPDDYTLLTSIYDGALTNGNHETGEVFVCARETLVAELKRELPPGHLLEGLEFQAVGIYQGSHKDFVFATNDPHRPIACVHLTFVKESQPPAPSTSVFATLSEWREEMQRDHFNYPLHRGPIGLMRRFARRLLRFFHASHG